MKEGVVGYKREVWIVLAKHTVFLATEHVRCQEVRGGVDNY